MHVKDLNILPAANTEIPRMWKEKGQSPMLAMHLGFPVGAAVGAQIASFFVSKRLHQVHSNMTFTFNATDSNELLYNVSDSLSPNDKDNDNNKARSRIEISFIIAGVYVSAVAIVFIGLQCCRTASTDVTQLKEVSSWKDIFKPHKWSDNGSFFGIKILLFFIFYEIFYCGCWASFGPFLTVYAVDSHLNFDPPEAATLSAVSTFADALSTLFCAVCLSRFLSVKVMLIIEIHGLLLASVGALILGSKYKIAFYFFICLFQVCRGPSYASIFSWVDHYILPLCTLLGVVRIIRNGSLILLIRLQGYLYDHVSIESIFYTSVGYAAAMCFSAYLIYYVTYGVVYRYTVQSISRNNEGTESGP